MSTQIPLGNKSLTDPGDRQTFQQKPRKLAQAHYTILSRMAANPGNPLRKLQGGFWVVDPDCDEYREGEWFASTQAVSAMLRLGFLIQREDSKSVDLTPAGIEALRTGVHTPLSAK